MPISVSLIKDSSNTVTQKRITTFKIIQPKWLLAEMNTHRSLSRNSASSRAIPVNKIIKQVMEDPFIPVHWGKNQKGMQANEELTQEQIAACKAEWLSSRDSAVQHVERLINLGLHKQISNRILEPWMWAQTVVTATDYDNFFALRFHKDAQPEFQEVARQMLELYILSIPQELEPGEWHIPFEDPTKDTNTNLVQSVARCCRVSYFNLDGTNSTYEKDLELYDTLSSSGHWSPFEHQAQCLGENESSGNFTGGWLQYRKQWATECRDFDYERKEYVRG